MTEEKALAYDGAITNLMSDDMSIALETPKSTWPTFRANDGAAPVQVAIEAPVMKVPSEMYSGEPKTTIMPLPEDKVGMDCEVETVGAINGVYRLVRPVTPCQELVETWQKNIKDFPTVRLTRLPARAVVKSRRGMQPYYVVSYNVACVGAIRHSVRREELAHWLIPAEPVCSSSWGILGYRSFMPASLLLTEELLAETAKHMSD